MTIPEIIAEIERLDKQATKGPWYSVEIAGFYEVCIGGPTYDSASILGCLKDNSVSEEQASSNARYTARSRTLLPLCARLLKVLSRYADGRMDAHDVASCNAELSAIIAETREGE